MKLLYKNITKYSKNEFNRFLEFHRKKYYIKYKIIIIICVIFTAGILIANILYKNWLPVLILLMLSIGIYVYYNYINIKKKSQNNKKQLEKEFTFEFYDNYMIVKNRKEKCKIRYYKFYKIFETKDNFYLYINREYSFLLNKNGFVLGEIEEFRKFIKKKCLFKYRLEK